MEINDNYLNPELMYFLNEEDGYVQPKDKPIDIKNKELVLDELILVKLKINDAYIKKLDKDEKIQEEYSRRKKQILTNKYFEKMINDRHGDHIPDILSLH